MNSTKCREFFEAIGESIDISLDTPVLVKYFGCDETVKEVPGIGWCN